MKDPTTVIAVLLHYLHVGSHVALRLSVSRSLLTCFPPSTSLSVGFPRCPSGGYGEGVGERVASVARVEGQPRKVTEDHETDDEGSWHGMK